MKKKALSLILALILCLGLLPTTVLAADESRTLEAGKTLTLRSYGHGSYDSETLCYGWEIEDESIVSGRAEGGHDETFILTGLRAGTTEVTLYAQELKWSSAVGDFVINDISYIWSITVTGTASPSSGGSSSSTIPAALVEPSVKRGVVGEDVSEYITGISVNGYNKNTGLLSVEFDGLWGFADKDFKLVIPFQFSSCLNNGYGKYIQVAVDKDRRNWFVIDNTGNYLMREGYPAYEFFGDYFRAYEAGKLGGPARYWYFKIESGTAKQITKTAFEEGIKDYEAPDEGKLYLQWASDGNWYFARAGHPVGEGEDWAWVIKRPEGVENGPNNKDRNRFICEGVMVVTRDGKSGAIDKSGKVVIPYIYDELCNSSGGYMAYKKDGQFGMLKNPVTPPGGEAVKPTTPTAPTDSDFTIEDGVLTDYKGNKGLVTIPNSVKEIGDLAFFSSSSLNNVFIPTGVTRIGDMSFKYCENLRQAILPNGVKEIGEQAFAWCESMTEVSIPASVTKIGKDAFLGCEKLSVTCIAGSEAEVYCKANGISFQSYGGSSVPPVVEDIPASGTAYASAQTIRVDGVPVKFQAYALKDADGNPTNYVRLRDVAYTLNGTGAQFEVGWSGGGISLSTEKAYTASGGEMDTPFSGDRSYRGGTLSVDIDGRSVPLTAITLTDASGGGYNYFKLRDLGQALGFKVDWSAEEGIKIQTK